MSIQGTASVNNEETQSDNWENQLPPLFLALTSTSTCKYEKISEQIQIQSNQFHIGTGMVQHQPKNIQSEAQYVEVDQGGGEITKIPVQSIWRRLGHTFNWR